MNKMNFFTVCNADYIFVREETVRVYRIGLNQLLSLVLWIVGIAVAIITGGGDGGSNLCSFSGFSKVIGSKSCY